MKMKVVRMKYKRRGVKTGNSEEKHENGQCENGRAAISSVIRGDKSEGTNPERQFASREEGAYMLLTPYFPIDDSVFRSLWL